MSTKILVFLSFITIVSGVGKCPTEYNGPPATDCVLVPGCNNPNGTVTPQALQCTNQLSDSDCEQLFPCIVTSGGPATCNFADAGGDTPDLFPMVRAPACISPNLQSIALQCAKQCAMCCLTAAYNCADDPRSPIDCAVNSNKCKDSSWTNIMAQYCPNTCGLCANGTCHDIYSGCNTMTALCKNVDWMSYMTTNCARTCEVCNTTTSTNTTNSTCSDIASNCASNANLCTNSTYRSLMLQQCCATCNTTSSSSSCSDIASNCVQNAYLCTDSRYRPVMLQQCCATCAAEVQCQQNNGHLISVANGFVNIFIAQQIESIIFSGTSNFWIGVHDVNGSGWTNIDNGSNTTFFEWSPGEPNNPDGQKNCVSIDKKGYWYADDCSNNFSYVCGVNEVGISSTTVPGTTTPIVTTTQSTTMSTSSSTTPTTSSSNTPMTSSTPETSSSTISTTSSSTTPATSSSTTPMTSSTPETSSNTISTTSSSTTLTTSSSTTLTTSSSTTSTISPNSTLTTTGAPIDSKPMHLIILFDGSVCFSLNNGLNPQPQIVQKIISNYTINKDLQIAFGTPISYKEFYFYGYASSREEVNMNINEVSACVMKYSMSKLYTPDTSALAFIVLLNSNGSFSDDAMTDAIHFRKTCLDSINAAVIVVQVDEETHVNPDLASKPEFFFTYDGTSSIGTKINDVLMEVGNYNMSGYTGNYECSTTSAIYS